MAMIIAELYTLYCSY